ncbi:pilus assembly protein [Nocardioides marmoriginsengisoli]|uniref:Pilus assembly protein n=1 Tax=Nocardioides marmoriginsengisoli TaxID=661483 RepID=A0A3N0CFF6_9ACTN|nr:TadE family type IV pilus minor pilin [Nocardioides marmoriginsengisoli]RNL62190.1 pilus assembly protein [Nocardioides marmoriginsengisoli]
MKRRRTDEGAVTAEAAVALPVLVLLAAALAWLVCFGVTQARTVDAAREVARALARGDDQVGAIALGRRVAPGGSRFEVRYDGEDVVVTVTARVRGPGGVFDLVPALPARSVAIARKEPGT